MKLKNHLSKEQLHKLQKLKKEEKVNWHELMGVNRDTYKRGKGGAIRNNRK
ncbi:hypothetical protein ACFSTA_12450 [Ornithinibacillus salinisoli]|uniref:Uncharacterized protein n=1 Tax=Ornithinibacillus salinisoli TaxID=1848459 RepID=A0ABW4W475_9BACI